MSEGATRDRTGDFGEDAGRSINSLPRSESRSIPDSHTATS